MESAGSMECRMDSLEENNAQAVEIPAGIGCQGKRIGQHSKRTWRGEEKGSCCSFTRYRGHNWTRKITFLKAKENECSKHIRLYQSLENQVRETISLRADSARYKSQWTRWLLIWQWTRLRGAPPMKLHVTPTQPSQPRWHIVRSKKNVGN